jgi:hypothetical protein
MAKLVKSQSSSGTKTGRTTKSLKCSGCNSEVENVDANTVSVVCWRCVNKSLRTPSYQSKKD